MNGTESQSRWTDKPAWLCYFAIFGGNLAGSLSLQLIFLALEIDILGLPFPFALLETPIISVLIFIVTLSFARRERAGLKELGLKKASFNVLILSSLVAVGMGILLIEIYFAFGPDLVETDLKMLMPTDAFQLVAMITMELFLSGPSQELAFRGFIQRGFENSFGKMKGLLIASVLFGAWHVSLYNVPIAVVAGLVLGYVWQRTGGNTTVSALMHGIINSIIDAAIYFLNL